MWFFLVKDSENWIPPLDYLWLKTEIYTQSPIEQYSMAVYHSMLILSGNDVGPRSTVHLLLVTFLILVGAIINASIFGNIAVILQQMNIKAAKLQEKVENANSTMKSLKIPDDLQKEIHSYLLYTHNNLEQQNELDMFLSQLSPSLKSRVRHSILEEAINKNTNLGMDKNAIAEILLDLSILLFQPEHIVIRQGGNGHTIYFIAHGEFSVYVSNEKKQEIQVNTVTEGQYFGEVALIKD